MSSSNSNMVKINKADEADQLESNSAQLTAKKFLALALTAYSAKQFEEAGCLFAQAAECADVTKLTDALLRPLSGHLPDSQPITDPQQLASGDEDTDLDDWDEDDDKSAEPESLDDAELEDSADSGDHEFRGDFDSKSASSNSEGPERRRVTSMYQIGKILAASMEATSSDDTSTESNSFKDFDASMEPDPDLPGEQLVPVSFSSVTVKKGLAVNSPVKLKQ